MSFYYEKDDENKEWLFVGSKNGLLNFIKCIDELEFEKGLSMDSHFGPYSYLKLMTWDKPFIGPKFIAGREEDFENLKNIFRQKLGYANINDEFIIDKEYSQDNAATIRVKIMNDDFDPVLMDSQL